MSKLSQQDINVLVAIQTSEDRCGTVRTLNTSRYRMAKLVDTGHVKVKKNAAKFANKNGDLRGRPSDIYRNTDKGRGKAQRAIKAGA